MKCQFKSQHVLGDLQRFESCECRSHSCQSSLKQLYHSKMQSLYSWHPLWHTGGHHGTDTVLVLEISACLAGCHHPRQQHIWKWYVHVSSIHTKRRFSNLQISFVISRAISIVDYESHVSSPPTKWFDDRPLISQNNFGTARPNRPSYS